MGMIRNLSIATISALALTACGSGGGGAKSRDFVRAVGSSTVYPFAKLFCAGVGAGHPDVENASRRMKKSEFEDCQKNGVTEVVEIQVGLDGIAFGEAKGGPGMALTPVDVYKALAANPFGKPNTAKLWSDVNPALPAIPILVYGPPSTSGTRDALQELILAEGCDSDAATKALRDTDEARHKKICTEVRDDGAYVDSGENDNLIVQKIAQNPKAVGIFGFSFLEENMDKLKGVTMSGVEPTYATISDFSYPGARPLYLYVKKAHLNAIKGLSAYVGEWAKAWGPDGYLKAKGMVIAPEDVRARSAEIVANMTPMDGADLK
jgi:phosphate transport system substrate-binding protein